MSAEGVKSRARLPFLQTYPEDWVRALRFDARDMQTGAATILDCLSAEQNNAGYGHVNFAATNPAIDEVKHRTCQ